MAKVGAFVRGFDVIGAIGAARESPDNGGVVPDDLEDHCSVNRSTDSQTIIDI